jgi:hypothetical protein
VIFNALIIVFLIPLALKGVRYRPSARRPAAPQPRDLRPRRPRRSLRRHQADRPAAGRDRPRLNRSTPMNKESILRPTLVLFAALTLLVGVAYPCS